MHQWTYFLIYFSELEEFDYIHCVESGAIQLSGFKLWPPDVVGRLGSTLNTGYLKTFCQILPIFTADGQLHTHSHLMKIHIKMQRNKLLNYKTISKGIRGPTRVHCKNAVNVTKLIEGVFFVKLLSLLLSLSEFKLFLLGWEFDKI